MSSVADLKQSLSDMVTMKFISSAFTEASAARIKNIRDAFERNKTFYDEVSHVYHLVKVNGNKNKKTVKKETVKKLKTVSVALTSNQRFYGTINVNIVNTLLTKTDKTDTDILIIGSTGNDAMKSAYSGRPYKLMNFAKDKPTTEEIKAFIERVKEYDSVVVYYPKFISLISQGVGYIDITFSTDPNMKEDSAELNIIFEPELTQMLEFFENQIRSILFLRVLLETELARTAARLVSMSAAEERADELIKEKKSELRKLQTSIVNIRLLETFAAIKKWKK
jgi:ATP synthase F1 gamma subunit